jgi:hypothetical protein
LSAKRDLDYIACVEKEQYKLIRYYTVAEGYDKCDYWIIGDKEEKENE